jgi:hypothetical protein
MLAHLTAEERVGLEALRCQEVQTPWPLVRERTILTERPPLVDDI